MEDIDRKGRACWASPIGGCDGKITGEHIVSGCLFDEKALMVQGLPWCLHEPKSIGKANLTRNILCKTHNSALSELDSAALAAFNVFRESTQLFNARKGINARSLSFQRFVINGPLLERWLLKTFINVALGQPLAIGPGQHDPGTPSTELIQIAFGKRSLESPSGLYLSGYAGEQVVFEDRVKIVTKSDGSNLVAAAFSFRGCRFFLNLLPQKLEYDGVSNLLYRDSKLKFLVYNNKGRQLLSHQIAIQW